MAQPNVVREPSMEEILASIRRIIESNEPGAGTSISPSLPPVYAVSDEDRQDDIPLTVDEELAAADFDDAPPIAAAAEPRFVAANSQAPLREAEAPARNLSLADVAARVRAASERNAAQLQASRELPPAMAARFAETRAASAEAASRNAVAEAQAPVIAPPAAGPLTEAVPPAASQEPRPEPVDEAPAAVARQAAAPADVPSPQQSAAEYAAPPLPSPLLSEAAGAQVARSFSELAAVIDGSQRRSLDEIAEEMLRPMLQEWLDDNLPTLVERLVREEIERVARGPRR